MTTAFCRVALLAWVGTAMLLFAARAAVDRDGARLVFDEARTLCERDAGAPW